MEQPVFATSAAVLCAADGGAVLLARCDSGRNCTEGGIPMVKSDIRIRNRLGVRCYFGRSG